MKLRNKSVLIFFLTAIIPILAVSLIALNISHRLLQESIGRDFTDIAHEKSLSISIILKDRLSQAKIIAASEHLKEAVRESNLKYAGKSHDEILEKLNEVDRQWLQAKGQTAIAEELLSNGSSRYLRELVQISKGEIGEIFVTDVHGATVAMNRTLTDYYQADEQWWEHSFNQGKGAEFIDDRGFDESMQALAVGTAVPIKHEDKVIGILKIHYKVQEIIDVIEHFEEHEEDHTFLMRSQGDIIAVSTGKEHPDISRLEKEIVAGKDAGWVEDIHQGKPKLMSYSPVDAEIFRRVPQPGEIRGVSGEKWAPTTWYLFIEIDHAKAFAPLSTLMSSIVICIIVTVIFSVVLAVLFARPVLAAIKKLQLGAIKVGKGNLEYEVDVNTNDEIGSLAISFNTMTKNLSDANAERKRIEEELKLESSMRTVLLDNVPNCFAFILKKGTREIVASNQAAKDAGGSPGKTCYQTYAQRDDPCPFCLAPELWDTNEPKQLEVEYRGRYYEGVWVSLSEELYVHYIFDITERKRAEEVLKKERQRFFDLLEIMPAFVYLQASDYSIAFANSYYRKHFGDVEGVPCYKSLWGRDEPCEVCPTFKVFATDQPQVWEWSEAPDGRAYDIYDYPFTDIDGTKLVLEMGIDISERKRTEEALQDKTKEMETLLRVVSHDLRTPLVNIEGFSGELAADCEHLAEMLENVTADEETKKELETLAGKHIPESLSFIRKGTRKMDDLLKGLSHLAKAGTVKLDIQRLDINDIAQQVVDTMKFSAKEANAAIEVETLPDCLGDEVQVNQMFSNLIGNAIKYLDPERAGRIRLWGKVEGNMSQYCVEDNGVGIPDDHKAKVFEVFHRVDPKSSASGDGLGLTTTKQIVERHKGRIWLESKEGEGSKFFISLPHHCD